MRVERDWLRNLIFSASDARRFTQDSPIMPDVWLIAGMFFCRDLSARVDLLLTPYKGQTPSDLAAELRRRLQQSSLPIVDPPQKLRGVNDDEEEDIWADGRPARRVVLRRTSQISINQTSVVAALTLEEIITCALPLTPWWARNIAVISPLAGERHALSAAKAEFEWLQRVVGVLILCGRKKGESQGDFAREGDAPAYLSADETQRLRRATREDSQDFGDIMRDTVGQAREFERLLALAGPASASPLLWKINLNRSAFVAISRSVPTTKADAARRVFDVKCEKLCWAVVDSGIDATHRAFNDVHGKSRVVRAYDFTRLRGLVRVDGLRATTLIGSIAAGDSEESERRAKRERQRIRNGQFLDWNTLLPFITVTAGSSEQIPRNDHGTHVAGILGACSVDGEIACEGVCPDIQLCDMRVLDAEGRGDEFSIIAALQFVRYLNANSDRQVIHGVNLSLSLLHDVENYACGRTPICEECERLVNSGVVVVAAAGNRGYERVLTPIGEIEAYRSISITDPGNGEAVITVGSTHRFEPHTYGASYFSSRGPTGDGRLKPDVLAPGEKIDSTLPGNTYGPKDGTSMAAPHVSGVAALLMARYTEFMGRPVEVKKIICGSATDLQRERYFQGAGLVDALRALQSV